MAAYGSFSQLQINTENLKKMFFLAYGYAVVLALL